MLQSEKIAPGQSSEISTFLNQLLLHMQMML